MVYNRDLFIRLISDYYDFCRRVFWHDDVAYPPPGGWPSITKESMANLKLNDTALDLIRHLPYTTYRYPDQYNEPHIMNMTYMIDYHHPKVLKDIAENKIEGYTECNPLPSSCVMLGMSQGRHGYYVVLDTDDGHVYWGDPNGTHDEPEPELNRFLEERFEETDARWAGYNAYEPAEFFGLCKQRFRELRWIGVDTQRVESKRMNDDWERPDPEHYRLVEFMKMAGWPGDGEGRDWDRDKFGDLLMRMHD